MQHAPKLTSTDLLKLAGLALVLVDHYGLFFDGDQTWWRVFGRPAAPIFFFLIGFARTNAIPAYWLVLGAILTGLDVISDGRDASLNILFSFALLRLVLPHVESFIAHKRFALPLLALLLAALAPLFGNVIEYGLSGWLWALLGLSARLAIAGEPGSARNRNIVAVICSLFYLIGESLFWHLDFAQIVALSLLIGALVATLLAFRRKDLEWRPPAPLAQTLNWIGRRSLEIYAASTIAMQVVSLVLDSEDDE
jgi:uncharacterized membrane protein YcfT